MSKKQQQEPQAQEPQAQEEKAQEEISENVLLQALVALFATFRVRDHRDEGR